MKWMEAMESLRLNDVPRYRFIAGVIVRDTHGSRKINEEPDKR